MQQLDMQDKALIIDAIYSKINALQHTIKYYEHIEKTKNKHFYKDKERAKADLNNFIYLLEKIIIDE